MASSTFVVPLLYTWRYITCQPASLINALQTTSTPRLPSPTPNPRPGDTASVTVTIRTIKSGGGHGDDLGDGLISEMFDKHTPGRGRMVGKQDNNEEASTCRRASVWHVRISSYHLHLHYMSLLGVQLQYTSNLFIAIPLSYVSVITSLVL